MAIDSTKYEPEIDLYQWPNEEYESQLKENASVVFVSFAISPIDSALEQRIEHKRDAASNLYFHNWLAESYRYSSFSRFKVPEILLTEPEGWSTHPEGVADRSGKDANVMPPSTSVTSQKDDSDAEKIRHLEAEIRLLEHQLQNDRPYLQLYRLGASTLFLSVASLLFWKFLMIEAPFHPAFALATLPVSLVVIAMGILVRPKKTTLARH